MKRILKVLFVLLISLGVVGCTSSKKELSDKEIDSVIAKKCEIKNDILSSSNSLLRVNMIFNDGKDKICYSPTTKVLTYSNAKIEEVDAMIVLYNTRDEYKALDNNSEQDIKLLEDFITSINEDLTNQQFVDWCLDKGKEEDKNHQEKLDKIPSNEDILSKIESKGYTVEKTKFGPTIKDSKGVLVVRSGTIAIYDPNYNFTTSTGFIYLPQNDAASKQENSSTTFIYEFSTNAFIEGTGTLEEYSTVQTIKVWYDSFLVTCGLTQEELATLK